MIPRVLEPEVMDTAEEAADYDAMDHAEVNRVFVDDVLNALRAARREPRPPSVRDAARREPRPPGNVLDVGTGTALIPIELCRREEFVGEVVGVDLAAEMLAVARQNVDSAGFGERIRVELVDAKSLPFDSEDFDIVMSNSIVHHIPEPAGVLQEMVRVLRPGGLLFVRDLLRPPIQSDVATLVETYAGAETPRAQQLFRQSLQAALTVGEIGEIASRLALEHATVEKTSDRHWTVVGRR